MSNIIHNPITDIKAVIQHFEKSDNTEIKYVCTTELPFLVDIPRDIFYRKIPHPKFKNNYFSIHIDSHHMYITNADIVETLTFDIIPTSKGWIYSRYRHDFQKDPETGYFIDGGRSYTRTNCTGSSFKVKDGICVLQ